MKRVILTVTWMLFLLSSAVVITLNSRPLYYHDVNHLKIEETSGLTKEQIRTNYQALINYNCLFHRGPLHLTLPMSKEERIHFQEVKVIFDGIQILWILCLLLLLTLGRKAIKHTPIFIRDGAILSAILPACVGLLAAINWDQAFILFHRLAFRNDYWYFDAATDPIITMLPDTFFFHCTLEMIILVALGILGSASFFRHKTMV